MSGFMVGDTPALVVADDSRLLLRSSDDLVDGFLDLFHRDIRLAPADGKQRALVQQVLQIGSCKAGGLLGNRDKHDVNRKRLVRSVHLEDLLPSLGIRKVDDNAPIEAARTQQSRVENVRPVRGRKDDDALVRVKAVHLDEQLVQGLLTFIVAAADACAAMAPHGVDFVDEHNAWSILLRLCEQVPDAACAHADKHLDELRTRHVEERHFGLAGDCASKQRLSTARRSNQQCALGNLGTHYRKLLGVLEVVDQLARLFLGLIQAGNILKRHARAIVHEQLGLALAKPDHLVVLATLHALHHEEPEPEQEHKLSLIHQQRQPYTRLRLVEVPLHTLCDQQRV